MKRLALLGLLCVPIAVAGCGGSSESPPSPKAQAAKEATKAAHHRIARAAADPSGWYTYVSCSSPHRCEVELDSWSELGTAVAIDHYEVKGGHPSLIPPSRIEDFLLADKYSLACAHRYLETGNRRFLPCARGA